MFAELKEVASILLRSVSWIAGHAKDEQRKEAVRSLLVSYYSLLRLARNGRSLLQRAGPSPFETIRELAGTSRESFIRDLEQGFGLEEAIIIREDAPA